MNVKLDSLIQCFQVYNMYKFNKLQILRNSFIWRKAKGLRRGNAQAWSD